MKNRIAFALLLAAAACWVPVDKGRQMDARIQRLEAESAATSQQIEEQRNLVRDRIARVDQKIAEVQKKLDELNATAHRSGADVVANQDRMQESLTRTVGQLEEQQHQLQLTDQRLSQLQSETEARFAALKGAGALEDYEGRKRAETLKRPTEKSEFFALAMQQEQSGERAVARQLYDEYVKKWPTDPRAADAWFRMGEISFGEKRYREAVLAYGKVAQDFPRSDKAPDALFRTGEAMLALDLRDDARAIFQDVVKRYPKTTASKKAGARLAEMSKNVKRKAPPKQ
jgi:tol-pal system protein YbgF